MRVQEQVRELQDQELPLVQEQALARDLERVQVVSLEQARGQVLALEARVKALAGLLGQVQAEVQGLALAVARAAVRG